MVEFRVGYWVPVGAVVVPSILLHLKLLHTVWKCKRKSQYKNLFYRLFLVQSIIELVLFFLFATFNMLVKDQPLGGDWLLATNGTPLPKMYYFGTIYYFLYVQVWGVIVQSLNRCFAVSAPFSRMRSWLEDTPAYACCLVNLAVPFAILFRLLLQEETSFAHDSRGIVIIYNPPSVIQTNGMHSTVVAVVGTTISALCYALILRKLVVMKHQLSLGKFRREWMLSVVGFVLFLSLCTMTAYYLIITLAAESNGNLVLLLRNFYIVPVLLLTFVNPWMLTITNSNLRTRLIGGSPSNSSAHNTPLKPLSVSAATARGLH